MILASETDKEIFRRMLVAILTQTLVLLEDIKQDRDIVTTVEQEVVMVVEEVVVPEVAQEPVIMVVEVVLQDISQVKLNFYLVQSYPQEHDKVVMLLMHLFLLKDILQQMIMFLSSQPNSGANEKTVTFTVTRNAGDTNTVTFTKQSGTGPSSITFGPNGTNVTAQISQGAVYTRTSSTNSGPGSLV